MRILSHSVSLLAILVMAGLPLSLPALAATTSVNSMAHAEFEHALSQPPIRAEDLLFKEAWKAYQKRSLPTLEKLSVSLIDHPLHAYTELWQHLIKLRADKDSPKANTDFINFIEKHQEQYIGERAATDYLLIVQDRINPSLFNRIYSLLQWNKQEPALLALYYWYNFDQTPTKVIQNFIKDTSLKTNATLQKLTDKVLTSDPNWAWPALVIQMQKQRWSEARRLVNELPEEVLPTSRRTLLAILNNPQQWLKKHPQSADRLSARAQIFLLLRLRSVNFGKALQIADKLSPKLAPQWKHLIWGLLAYEATVDQKKEGASLFSKAGSQLFQNPLLVTPDLVAGWATRAYLKVGDWPSVNQTILQMSKGMQKDETWIYWRARALEAQGNSKKAQTLFRSIADKPSFYGKLACDQLKISYPQETILSHTPSTKSTLRWASDPNMQRAQAFYRLEMYFMGHREWNWALRDRKPDTLLSATLYAKEKQLLHRMINTGQRLPLSDVDWELLYPLPQREQISRISQQYQVPISWVYGIIRQESRFMPSVTSGVGAQGLMQIMPKTARWLIKKLDLIELKNRPITQLETNVALGSSYLRMLHDDFEGSYALASAAYNAGPVRARLWRKTLESPMEGAIFIESIPFFETRDYVKNVLSNTFMYACRLQENLGSFTSFVGTITPVTPNTPESDLP